MIEETLLIIATLKQTMNFIDQQVRKKKKKKTLHLFLSSIAIPTE
jgi:hypothetical protein